MSYPNSVYLALVAALVSSPLASAPLALDEAVEHALDRDPVISGIHARARQYRESAIADSALPDPMLGVGAMRDSGPGWRIEWMQAFPPAGTRAHTRRAGVLQADAQTALLEERQRFIRRELSSVFHRIAQERTTRDALDETADVLDAWIRSATARYAQGAGRQQELVALQLERHRIDDRRLRSRESEQALRASLHRWLEPDLAGRPLLPPDILSDLVLDRAQLADRLGDHPALQAAAKSVEAASATRDAVTATKRPAWAVTLGHTERRGASMMPDESSVMLSMSVPLFAADRQNRRIAAATAATDEAHAGQRAQALDLMARLEQVVATHERLMDRRALYRDALVPAAQSQVESALAAYEGGADVLESLLRATIALVELRIESAVLDAELGINLADLEYLTGVSP